MKFAGVILWLILAAGPAQARVFDITSEKVAGYFLATGGPSVLKTSAVLNEDNAAYTYSGEVPYNYSGEFGFLYAKSAMSLRFGFEILKPTALKDSKASNGTTDLYNVNSDVSVFMPKLGLEINLQRTATYRAFLQAYAGAASVSYKNDYTMINYAGQSDHSVEAKGTAVAYGGTLGVESHLTDTTTYVFEFGYRQMKVDGLKYGKDVTTFRGSQTAGDPVLDATGKPRTLDFTGGYISFGFRFYL